MGERGREKQQHSSGEDVVDEDVCTNSMGESCMVAVGCERYRKTGIK